jgi:hypothetical protein
MPGPLPRMPLRNPFFVAAPRRLLSARRRRRQEARGLRRHCCAPAAEIQCETWPRAAQRLGRQAQMLL